LRGVEQRIEAGLDPCVGSVASLFVSRWDAAVAKKVPEQLRNKLGIAIAQRTYAASRELLGSERWRRAYNFGARPQRVLWASTGAKDPKASPTLYVDALAAPFTVNTMPEATLKLLAAGTPLDKLPALEESTHEDVLKQFAGAGIDVDALAAQLQTEGANSFVASWNELIGVIASKSAALAEPALKA
jgi:transaldolase